MRSHNDDEDAGVLGWLARGIRLLLDWWQADRVRASPREGRLLRLRVPCIVRIGGRYVQVIRRRTGVTEDGPYVCYDCEIDGGRAELRVQPANEPWQSKATWVDDAGERFLDANDIEVFG